jgi:hypothetical protein
MASHVLVRKRDQRLPREDHDHVLGTGIPGLSSHRQSSSAIVSGPEQYCVVNDQDQTIARSRAVIELELAVGRPTKAWQEEVPLVAPCGAA